MSPRCPAYVLTTGSAGGGATAIIARLGKAAPGTVLRKGIGGLTSATSARRHSASFEHLGRLGAHGNRTSGCALLAGTSNGQAQRRSQEEGQWNEISFMDHGAAGSILLASCGGQGDDTLGDQAQDAAEARADALEDAADNAGGSAEDAMEAQADVVRESGEARQEAIDDADVDADAMTPAQKDALVNGR
jgi:hypothetical protein